MQERRGDALYQIREKSISEAEAALSEAQEKIGVYQAKKLMMRRRLPEGMLNQNKLSQELIKKKDSFEKVENALESTQNAEKNT